MLWLLDHFDFLVIGDLVIERAVAAAPLRYMGWTLPAHVVAEPDPAGSRLRNRFSGRGAALSPAVASLLGLAPSAAAGEATDDELAHLWSERLIARRSG